MKSKNKIKIVSSLKEKGFTDNQKPFQLFYWPNDGWYLHCDQCAHDWIGQNTKHVLECVSKGDYDRWLTRETY